MRTSVAYSRNVDSTPRSSGAEQAIIDDAVQGVVSGTDESTANQRRGNATMPASPSAFGNDQSAVIPTKIVLPSPPEPTSKFLPLNEWEGVVESIDFGERTFSAQLDDLTDSLRPRERAEFFMGDVRADDRDLLQPGAIFRWVIGMREDRFGTVERASRIIFRRLPAYSNNDIVAAELRAERLSGAIKGR